MWEREWVCKSLFIGICNSKIYDNDDDDGGGEGQEKNQGKKNRFLENREQNLSN